MGWLTELWEAFEKAFLLEDRWMAYIKGFGITLEVSLFAVLLGVALGVLLALMYRAYGQKGKRLFLLSAGTGSLYAATDEFHQLFVEGRSCQLTDWGIDTCGVIAGAAVVFLLWRGVGRRGEMES